LQTNDTGIFTAPALPPAFGYRVRIDKTGFTSYEARDVQVNVGRNVSLNVELQVAA